MLSELYKTKISEKWKLTIKIDGRVIRLAQLVEHQTFNLRAMGWSPISVFKIPNFLTFNARSYCLLKFSIKSRTHRRYMCRNSSVGRASDWRSEGPWFNPGFRQEPAFDCSVGRAGDCSWIQAIIPRLLVQIRFEGPPFILLNVKYYLHIYNCISLTF